MRTSFWGYGVLNIPTSKVEPIYAFHERGDLEDSRREAGELLEPRERRQPRECVDLRERAGQPHEHRGDNPFEISCMQKEDFENIREDMK